MRATSVVAVLSLTLAALFGGCTTDIMAEPAAQPSNATASPDQLGAPRSAPLTLDVGHLHCLGEVPIADRIKRFGSQLVNVHIEDMRAGIHEHLMFGDGEIDFAPVIAALKEVTYSGGLHVELSRHSHMAFDAARQAYAFLQPLVN